jgi:hypothetical protein
MAAGSFSKAEARCGFVSAALKVHSIEHVSDRPRPTRRVDVRECQLDLPGVSWLQRLID